jgi:hypothetical protein
MGRWSNLVMVCVMAWHGLQPDMLGFDIVFALQQPAASLYSSVARCATMQCIRQ